MKILFKERLRELRKEKNLTQQQLAELLRVSQSSVSAWEVGKNTPSLGIVVKLAFIFEEKTDYILGCEEN